MSHKNLSRLASPLKLKIPALVGALFILLAVSPSVARAQGPPDLPAPTAVVSPHVFVSLDRVPRGRSFDVAIVVGILSGFHMNAHKVNQKYQIPTTLSGVPPRGIKILSTSYPPGRSKKLAFSDVPLSVYTGSFTIRMKMIAEGGAKLGKLNLPFLLHYQACNDSVCLPPAKVSVSVAIDVAPAGAKARPVSPDIFGAPAARGSR